MQCCFIKFSAYFVNTDAWLTEIICIYNLKFIYMRHNRYSMFMWQVPNNYSEYFYLKK